MKRVIVGLGFVAILFAASNAAAKKACTYAAPDKLKDQIVNQVEYPATGASIKDLMRLNVPEEFKKQERSCIEKHLKATTVYPNADAVLTALGIGK
jgi:hypothetical protein